MSYWQLPLYYSNNMKIMAYVWLMPFLLLMGCGDGSSVSEKILEKEELSIEAVPADIQMSAAGETVTIMVKADAAWTVKTDGQSWYSLSVNGGYTGETAMKITTSKNLTEQERTAVLSFAIGTDYKKEYTFRQAKGVVENYVPDGYILVWQDEFNDARLADGKPALPRASVWWYETGDSGWGNHEIQNYVAGFFGTDSCAVVADGTLKIIAKKRGAEVLSVRMNTIESWKYGYFEARLKLPTGKGTWPAFWMMPRNYTAWPDDGEIDIMEEVGYDPNVILSTVHCKAYNHSIGTQKSGSIKVPTAQNDFHVYAVEWTEDFIKGYVDGKCYFTFDNDKKGNKDTWPFNAPFYLKLNLAWGGDWGGAQGIDESALPATYEIDYVRVFQKNN